MSTPSAQEPELVELCDYLTRQPRESVSPHTEHRLESENDVPRSPYAPKPAHERAASRLRALAGDGSEEAPNRAPSEIRRRIMADQELARIEASLRLLHRNRSTGMRLPRGPNIPLPADRTIASAGRESHDSVEQVPAWLTRPHRLEPTIMPPPPPGAGRKLHVGLSITLACFAGALAYYAFMAARPSQSGANFEITSAAPSSRASAPEVQGLSAFARVQHPEMEESASQISAAQIELARREASQVIAPSPAATISERHSLPQALPSAEENAASPRISSVPAVEPEEIDALIEQGRKFMADGDIVTARLLFKRAAKLENATAALALAAAYDPIVLSKLGVLGVDMDVEKARLWYQKAGELGSSQALERLRALAER